MTFSAEGDTVVKYPSGASPYRQQWPFDHTMQVPISAGYVKPWPFPEMSIITQGASITWLKEEIITKQLFWCELILDPHRPFENSYWEGLALQMDFSAILFLIFFNQKTIKTWLQVPQMMEPVLK